MMTNVIGRCARIGALGVMMTTAMAVPARAQLNGENLLGDMGVKSGSQPHPGLYVSSIYYRYLTGTIKDPAGQRVILDASGDASQTIQAGMPLAYYVSRGRVLGAHVGAMAALPIARGALEAPGFGLSEQASTGLSDLYLMPAQLGWHFGRADVTVGVGLFVPTGRYSAGADDNLGKGMWSYEVSGGGTLYLDRRRSFSLSSTAYWETHSRKEGEVRIEDATIANVRVGQLLTLEGGLGKSFLRGAASVGIAYYAQWKVTPDDLGAPLPAGMTASLPKHRVFGIGPDLTVPIATKKRLISLINVRYLIEQGAQVKTQGHTLMITNTIPIGGVSAAADHK